MALLLRAALLDLPAGGLAPVLRELAGVLSERLEAREKARSEPRACGTEAAILALSPIVILLLIGAASPGYLAAYRTSAGTVVCSSAAALICGCYLLMRRLGRIPEPRAHRRPGDERRVAVLLGLPGRRRPAARALRSLAAAAGAVGMRSPRAEGAAVAPAPAASAARACPSRCRGWSHPSAGYEGRPSPRGQAKTGSLFFAKKALLAVAVPFVPLLPYLRRPAPSLARDLVAGPRGAGVLPARPRRCARGEERREAIFLDLPEAISVMALSLGAGQSLRQALELAARDCGGPLGDELTSALSLARRDRALGEREALVAVAARAASQLLRFAELLAAKESPYLEFLRSQAAGMRAEQNRYLERAADRAYLAMHAPLVPLLAVARAAPRLRLPPLPHPNDLIHERRKHNANLIRSGSGFLAATQRTGGARRQLVNWVVLAVGLAAAAARSSRSRPALEHAAEKS